ncbi:MAG: hypothetical protein ACRDIY_02265, partial [Chloroflexota bacterium]
MERSPSLHPSLDQLRRQAKDLLRDQRAGDANAIARCRAHPRLARLADPDLRVATLSLSDAQLIVARECGLASWPRLKRHVEDRERVEERLSRLRANFAAA